MTQTPPEANLKQQQQQQDPEQERGPDELRQQLRDATLLRLSLKLGSRRPARSRPLLNLWR